MLKNINIINMHMEDKRHIQLPHKEDDTSITPGEQLIYIAIKSYMNNETKESFPSLRKLSNLTGAAINTIRNAITRLEELNYLKVVRVGRKQVYKFKDCKHFEPFSYEFLNNKDLTFTEKAYLVASQQYMFKNGTNGSISLSVRDLSEKINLPKSTIYDCDKSLEAKHFLTIVNNQSKDFETGLPEQTKIFHLAEFGQAVVGILNNHESRLDQLEKQNQLLLREIAELRKERQSQSNPIIL